MVVASHGFADVKVHRPVRVDGELHDLAPARVTHGKTLNCRHDFADAAEAQVPGSLQILDAPVARKWMSGCECDEAPGIFFDPFGVPLVMKEYMI